MPILVVEGLCGRMNFEPSLSNRDFFHIRSSEQVFKSIQCPSSLSLRSCSVLLCFSSRSVSQCTWRQSRNYTSVADSQRQHNIVLIIVYWRHANLGLVHTETLRHRFGCRKRMCSVHFICGVIHINQ